MADSWRPVRRLSNPIREYAWGSHRAIAELLGHPVPSERPQAELWMGTHAQGSSRLEDGADGMTLRELVQQAPQRHLGRADGEDGLSFLLKVLAAGEPLSVQAHPDARQAAEGFARENAVGIDRSAPHRNYRDANAKPEIILALTPFVLIRGFRPPAEIYRLLRQIGLEASSPLLACLAIDSDQSPGDALRRFFERLMALPRDHVDRLLTQVDAFLAAPVEDGGELALEWRWMRRLAESYPGDRGVLAPLWLHTVELQPGEAMFTPPRILHAYLHGVGIELMGNSDNVLRGGLTPKHVDVPELMRVVDFAPQSPEILHGKEAGAVERIYETSSEAFRLSRLDLAGRPFDAAVEGPEILLCTEGQAELQCGALREPLSRGQTLFVAAGAGRYQVEGQGTVFRAREGTKPRAEPQRMHTMSSV